MARRRWRATTSPHFSDRQIHYFDLEDPGHLNRLADPKLALESLEGLIVIDEIQRIPELFPLLRVLIDRKTPRQRYLILGSASRELIRQSSETLAGRIAYLELPPFVAFEAEDIPRLWLRGGFPPAYLARSDDDSMVWRKAYVTTFLERDVPALGIDFAANTMRRFWMMLAHWHGNVFNASDLARSLDVSSPTIKRYLDILDGTFMIRTLQPWYANLRKRQVKSPKIYFRDAGDPAWAAEPAGLGRVARASRGRRVMGGIRVGTGHPNLPCRRRRMLLLGDPHASGAGPADRTRHSEDGFRVQILVGAEGHKVDAHGARGPRSRRDNHRLPGRRRLPAGQERPGGRPSALGA